MIRFIAAIDEKRGLADDRGIPWNLPADKEFFRDETADGLLLMGKNTYLKFKQPLHGAPNYVATKGNYVLRQGFEVVSDVPRFYQEHSEKFINNIGGAVLFATTFDYADELILTLIQADFNCTKFFPEYENDFVCYERGKPITENGTTFTFTRWRRK